MFFGICGGVKGMKKDAAETKSGAYLMLGFLVFLSVFIIPWWQGIETVESKSYRAPQGYQIVIWDEGEKAIKSSEPMKVQNEISYNLLRMRMGSRVRVVNDIP